MKQAPSSAERDERLAAVLTQLSDAQRTGKNADVAAACAAHPDLADELMQLWATTHFARIAVGSAASVEPVATDTTTLSTGSGALPRTFGDYELLAELGRGGMGVVFKARQRNLNRIVALKMLRHGDLAGPEDRARIRAEARAAALLKHPNIAAVYDVGEAEGRDYFTMPYIEGRSLADLLAEGPLPPRDAARIVATIAHAVDHAHQTGIIHRDLKPGNILLAALGSGSDETSLASPTPSPLAGIMPIVTDFGLAKQLALTGDNARLTQTGAIVGTPSFMPPEQAASRRGEIGPPSDVYSLGAILYNALTGRPPFQAASRADVMFMVLEQDPVPPRLLNPLVDRELEIICLKCLQKSPEMRYPSAEALARDLESFLRGESLSIRPSDLRELLGWFLRPTHHITVLENWGLLWMAHSVFTLILCTATWLLQRVAVTERWPYLVLWGGGVLTWAPIFWRLRRRVGPVTFVERQIAHTWAAGVTGAFGVLLIEMLLGRPVLEFAPLLPVVAAMVFLSKAGILSGMFYISVAALCSVALLMIAFPTSGMLLYGIAVALSYFIPGWIFWRRRQAALRRGTNRTCSR